MELSSIYPNAFRRHIKQRNGAVETTSGVLPGFADARTTMQKESAARQQPAARNIALRMETVCRSGSNSTLDRTSPAS